MRRVVALTRAHRFLVFFSSAPSARRADLEQRKATLSVSLQKKRNLLKLDSISFRI